MNPHEPHDEHRSGRFSSPRSVPLARYHVILHRDADKSLLFVIRAVMELTRYCKEEATIHMWESYHLGRSIVAACRV